MEWFSLKRIWQLAAFALALGGAAVTMWAPLFARVTESGGVETTARVTAPELVGSSVFLVIAIPLLLAALPLPLRGRPWVITSYVSAVGLILYTVTGILSIGLFFLPTAVIAVVGAFVRPPDL